MHHIFKIWQESWSQQLDNKLHSVKPVIGAWPVMPLRRTDVKLTRLRIGHTRFTHRHLLFGERAPECPSCHVSYTVHHILIDCPVFNNHRITFFNSSHLTLPDLSLEGALLSLQLERSHCDSNPLAGQGGNISSELPSHCSDELLLQDL
ncbi:RNase H domain-containing protein [Trichonephila clavipes]|nr:RNase H domain-containing protein [Trichonephila clavipes]